MQFRYPDNIAQRGGRADPSEGPVTLIADEECSVWIRAVERGQGVAAAIAGRRAQFRDASEDKEDRATDLGGPSVTPKATC